MCRDLDSGAQLSQRRGVPQQKLSQMSHPLLGDRPTLQLMPSRADIAGVISLRLHGARQNHAISHLDDGHLITEPRCWA